MTKLNIGAGYLNRKQDEVALDIDFACKPDVCGDVQDLPFKDSSFDSIYACHCLEHIQNIVRTMNECWRVLKKDGKFNIRVPLFPTVGSIADPSHVRFFIVPTFDYFTVKGKLTGLKNTFKMEDIFISNLTEDTQEICVQMRK